MKICQQCGNRTYKGAELCSTCKPRPKQPRTDAQRARERAREHTRSYASKKFPCASCGKPVWHGKGTLPPGEATCQPCRRRANTRPCVQCGEEFYSAIPEQKFCSLKCKGADERTHPEKPCEWCGRIFKSRWANGTETRYCSSKCYGYARMDAADNWPRTPIWHVDCAGCGRLFIAKLKKQILCGKECRRKYGSRYTSEAIMRRYHADPAFRDEVISKAQNRRASRLGLERITQPKQVIAFLYERDQGICGICHEPVTEEDGPHRPSMDHIIPLARGGTHTIDNLQLAHLSCNYAKNATVSEDDLDRAAALAANGIRPVPVTKICACGCGQPVTRASNAKYATKTCARRGQYAASRRWEARQRERIRD